MRTSDAKKLLLLLIGAVIMGATLYSIVGRDSRLPPATPDAAAAAPQPRPTETPTQGADRAQELQQRLAENPRDPAALAEALRDLLADPARRAGLAAAGRARAAQFDWRACARAHLAAYEKAAA
jgi:hypothetical protein